MDEKQLNIRDDDKSLKLYKSLVGKNRKKQVKIFENITNDTSDEKSIDIIFTQLQKIHQQLQHEEKIFEELKKELKKELDK